MNCKAKSFPLLVLFGLSLFSCKIDTPFQKAPNILLIVADDLGYEDMGSFGGDISTPNLDQLTKEGIRFSRFHTALVCPVTRAMLLSGNFNHFSGLGAQSLVTTIPGFEGRLSDRILLIPELLHSLECHAYLAGKCHLGGMEGANPAEKAFEKSFVIKEEGGANYFSEKGVFPDFPVAPYTENGTQVKWSETNYLSNLEELQAIVEEILYHTHPTTP